jgi:serine/threonine protein kinase
VASQPKKVGPWTVRGLLKLGGQGTVYTAQKDEGAQLVAVKVLKISKPKRRARFIQEVKVHASLSANQATNIIPLLDHNLEELTEPESGVRGYVAMPLAQWSLQDLADTFRGRTELCLDVFRGIVKGICNAHAAGVIHRDIKPANILFLDTSFNPLVSDFGICFLKETPDSERLTEVGETVGPKFFMAPEQERGGVTEVDFSADIYTLGKVLHYMLTGRYLYREKLAEAFSEDELANDKRLGVIHQEILAKTVIEDPAARIQSAHEVLRIVEEMLSSLRLPEPKGGGG